MKTTEFNRKITSKQLNENFAKIYGSKVNLQKYNTEQLEDFRNKIRTKISQIESQSKFNETLRDDQYQRDKMILDILNSHLQERSNIQSDEDLQVNENVDPKQAGVVQAAIDMQNKVKNMLEDLGSMMTKTMVALSDDIKDTMGAEVAEQFNAVVHPALEAAMENMQSTKAQIEQGVGVLTGENTPEVIGQEPEAVPGEETGFENDIESEMPADADEFAASDAEAGGAEVAGRELRENKKFKIRKPTIAESNSIMFKLAK